MIVIESKRKKTETILRRYPGAVIADVTSHAEDDLVKLSPFYPVWWDSGAVQRGTHVCLCGSGLVNEHKLLCTFALRITY